MMSDSYAEGVKPPAGKSMGCVETGKYARHFVYLVTGDGRTKIGHSAWPARRVRDMQTGSPVVLELEHAWEVRGRESAVRLEGRLHKALSRYRTAGEWFSIEARWARAIGDAMIYKQKANRTALLETLGHFQDALQIVTDFAVDEDDEEADLWRAVAGGYLTRAYSFGLEESGWDILIP